MARKKNGKDIPQEMLDSAHRVWLAGLGALARAEEEGGRFFRRLVEQGEDVESRGRGRVEEVVQSARGTAEKVRRQVDEAGRKARTEAEARGEELSAEVSRLVDQRMEGLLQRLGVPSRSEIQSLTERVEALNRHVEGMYGAAAETPGGEAKSGKPAPTKSAKPAPKSATPQEVAPEAVELTEGTQGAGKGGKRAKAAPPKKTAATNVSSTKTGPAKGRKKKEESKED